MAKRIENRFRLITRGILWPFLMGWCLHVPLAWLVPKRRGSVLVIGLKGSFADNAKYAYLAALRDRSLRYRVSWLAETDDVAAMLQHASLPHIRYPSWRGIWQLLRTETVVVDTVSWIRPTKYHLLYRARKVQLWHGCPLKQIEADDLNTCGPDTPRLLRLCQWAIGRYPSYDLLLSPSPYFTRMSFRRAFRPRNIVEHNYPRNAALLSPDSPHFHLGTDRETRAAMTLRKAQKQRLVLYMPTFRDTGGNAHEDGALDLERLNAFALRNDLTVVLKLHPVARESLRCEGYDQLLLYRSEADIYPALHQFDALITDYSSIYFDFLHLARPILFFAYDLQKYRDADRAHYFRFEDTAPGPVLTSQDALEAALRHALDRPQQALNTHAQEREHWLELAFNGGDPMTAHDPIWQAIEQIAQQPRRGPSIYLAPESARATTVPFPRQGYTPPMRTAPLQRSTTDVGAAP